MGYSFSHGISAVGNVRADNQDALTSHEPQDDATLESHGTLYAVADGMGGYEHGGIASSLALEVFTDTFYSGKPNKSSQNLKQGIQAANTALLQKSTHLMARMGTTLSAINIIHNRCYVAHVGDSRVYHVRGRKAKCLTNDHTAVGQMVRMGLLSPEKVRTHDRRSILDKCLGMNLFVQPDIQEHPVEAGDYFVLCTDGVWASIEDDEFGRLVHDIQTPEDISKALTETALARESDDNVTALVIYIETLYTPQVVQSPASSGLRPLLRSLLYGKG